MRRATIAVLLVACAALCSPVSAAAAGACPHPSVSMHEVTVSCEDTKESLHKKYHDPHDPYVYRVEIICTNTVGGGITIGGCGTPEWCRPPEPVYRYTVYRAPRGTTDWESTGTVCLNNPDEITQTITETEIREAFTTLTWPAADLIIDPDPRTLVNTDTAFHTNRTQPVTQTITLLGTEITLQATPTTWTWHWAQPGDPATPTDLTPHTTTTPGTPRPHPTITHTYTRKGQTHPSVDVTYTGQYQIANGPWHPITNTHTVPGTPTPLTIHQARPRLIH